MARNADVLQAFIEGKKPVKTKNLRIDDTTYGTVIQLINYNTVIAERHDVGGQASFTVNETKYSQSTTTIQNALKRSLEQYGYKYTTVDNIAMGEKNL